MKQFKLILLCLLALCTVFAMCACGETADTSSAGGAESSTAVSAESSAAVSEAESETSSEDEQSSVFAVAVVDGDGNPVSGVMVQICKDTCLPAMTDANGIATFALEITDGYKLSVMSCPDGYTYTGEAEIYLESGATEYTLTLQKDAE